MAFHKIQCPHCFTEYTVSDEQYQATEGIMRCGTCREQFKSILVTEGLATPQFDPRDVFIEPLSEPLAASEGGDKKLSSEPELSYVSYEKSPRLGETDVELMSSHDFEYTDPKEVEVPDHIKQAYANSNELSTSQILKNLREKPSNKENQTDLTRSSTNTLAHSEPSNKHVNTRGEALINQVDILVDEKLVSPAAAGKALKATSSPSQKIEPKLDDDFFLDSKRPKPKKKRSFFKFISGLISLFLFLILAAGLTYQLWLKQLIKLPTDNVWLSKAEKLAEPYLEIAKKKLQTFDITLPQRRNLSKLELVSAQTVPHSTRSTTMLLKVSLINRADISQPLPWLEMSLSDADGRLVARRNLSPKDYIYNNKTNSKIGPNELKKITIELLSFPKAATGYEIKLLNN